MTEVLDLLPDHINILYPSKNRRARTLSCTAASHRTGSCSVSRYVSRASYCSKWYALPLSATEECDLFMSRTGFRSSDCVALTNSRWKRGEFLGKHRQANAVVSKQQNMEQQQQRKQIGSPAINTFQLRHVLCDGIYMSPWSFVDHY